MRAMKNVQLLTSGPVNLSRKYVKAVRLEDVNKMFQLKK